MISHLLLISQPCGWTRMEPIVGAHWSDFRVCKVICEGPGV